MLQNKILTQTPNSNIYSYKRYGNDTTNEPDGIPNPEILIFLAVIVICAIVALFKVS